METDPLKAARLELAPELVPGPPDPGSALVGRAGTDLTEEQLDVAMYQRLQRAKQPSTVAGFSRNGITMTAEQIAGVSLSQEKDALRAYRDRRIARGEEPFQYLAKAKAKQDNAAFREQLPFFGTLFAGPEKFAEAFPEEQRAAVAERFAGSMNPAREKMATANLMLVSEMTGKPVEELQKLWPAYRNQYARERLGAQEMVDDVGFYALAGSKVAEQQTEMETARKVAEITRFHAVRGKPLGEAITAAKAAAGPDWKKYEAAAREGYANVLVDFDDRTIKSGNKLFEFAKKAEGGLVTDLKFEDGQAAAMAAYGMADQDTRDKMMAIIGTRAVEEGTTVENYFASLAAGVGGGTNSFARSLASGTTRREAEEIRKLLKGGRMPTAMDGLTTAGEILDSLSVGEQAFDRSAPELAGEGPYRSMTPEERKEWEARATMLEGYAAFLTDTETAGIKVRKYLDNKREGFWDTLADTTVMMAESLPVMAAALVPYGGGVLLAGSSYAEKNLSTLRREAPDADPETLKRLAFTSGMIEAGIDRLQILTLGAKMPKVNAALLKYGKPGLVGVIAVQAATKGTAEFGQEIAQDLTLPQIQEFASALTEDIPGPDWKAVLQREYEALGDIARVSFGFGIIGGAGSSIVNYIDAGKVRETLQDREGLALAGFTPETVEAVATLAETNPAAAAETLKAAVIETPADTRKANSAAAKAKLEADPPPTPEEAAIPSIEKDAQGGFIVRYPDGMVDQARSETDALEAVRAWEMDDLNRMDVANRELARELEATHSANPELGVSTKFTGRQVTMQDWAGGNAAKIEQARQRVRIALRQEFATGERKDDGSSIPDAELPLDAYLILGSSKNFGGAVTRISMEIHKRGNVATVLEEHAEGVAKWAMESGKYSRADMIRGIRETEAATGKQTLPDDLDSMAPEAAQQAIVEAFSRLAVANAFGKVPESSLSAKFKALFRALKEAFTAILSLAGEIRALQLAGQMDEQFEYWLDVAGGVSEQYQQENLQREAEREMLAEAFDGIPEVQAAIKGRLPHPDTPGNLFPGEIRGIYDGIANNPESGGSKGARTKTANAFFLPVGEKADLDEVREFLNEKGFGFDTPADMLEAVDLSVNYGKPQYAVGDQDQGFEMESFSVERLDAELFGKIGEDALRLEQPRAKYEDKRQLLLDFSASIVGGGRPGLGRGASRADVRRFAKLQIVRERLAEDVAINTRVDFLGETISGPADLAVKALALRNPRFETFYLFALKEAPDPADGWQIADVMAITSRVPGSAAIFENGRQFIDGIMQHADFLEKAGAQGYIMLHNHPSGDPTPSRQDFLMTKKHAEEMASLGHTFIDHIVINHDRFARIETDGYTANLELIPANARAGGDRFAWPAPGTGIGDIANSPGELIRVAQMMEESKDKAETVQVLFLGTRLNVVAMLQGKLSDIRTMTAEQLQDYARTQGASYMAIVGKATDREHALHLARNTASTIKGPDGKSLLLESIFLHERGWISAIEEGIIDSSRVPAFFGGANADGARVQETFAAVRADSPLLKAIDALAAAPEAKAKVFAKMRDKVTEVRDRMNATRRTAGFSEEELDPDRFEKLRDLATLEAIAKALPAAIRGRLVGEFRPLEELKTAKGREAYLVKLLPSIERALEGHLQDQFRQAIRREMQRGAVKVAEAKTRGGKIGALGHEIFDMAKAAMTMDPETAAAEADKIQAKIEGGDSLTMDQLEELDAKLAAVELFADYQAADSRRLELALELLKDSYRAGRAAWLETLMERRMLRDQRVLTFQRGLGLTFMDPDGIERPLRITDAMRNAAKRADEKLGTRFLEGLMSAILSGSQKIRRMGELTSDPVVKRTVEDMEDAFAGAEALETDLNLADNAALSAAMRSILGVSTEYGLAKKLRELSEAKGAAPVEKIEGLKKEKITVPINLIESLLAGEVAGFTTESGVAVELDAHDLEALQEEWDRFQDLQEEDQGRKRVLNFTRLVASGKRITIGEVSQLEGLQLLLTMRQPDQARKLERLGYDAETLAQLEAWLRPEVQALGAWMVDFLKSEQDAVDALHRQEKGVALRLVDNYFPVRNDVSGSDSGGLSLDGGGAQQTGRSVGFIKERVANNAPPAYVNALAVFLAHRAQSNFWKSHVTPMREWGGIVRDERFSGAVKTKLGNTYYQSLSRLMERIEAGGVLGARQQLGFERMVKGLMRNFSLGTLGLRMSTLMVNTTAAMNAGLEIPARDLIKGMMLAAKRPEAFKDAWNSPVIQRRLKDGSSIEAKLAKSSGPSTKPTLAVLQSLAEKGVAPINVVDTAANLLGAASVWEYTRTAAVRAGLPDAAARVEADQAVEKLFRRAAQPASRFARSEIEMRALDNPISALMSLFISEPRKNAAIAFMAGRELLTGKGTYGKQQAAQQLAMGLVVMVAAEYVVRSGYAALAKAKDDDEDGIFARWWGKLTDGKAWAHAFATSHLRAIPLAGEAWNQVTASALDQQVFDSSPNPLNKVARVGVDFAKGLGEEKTAEDAIEGGIDIVQAFGSALPGGPFFAQLANVADFAEGVATSNGVDFTDADRAARIKARYSKHGKELDELHGKTTGEDGKPRPEIREKKAAAKADWLRSALAPLPAAEQGKVLETLKPSKEVRDLLE